MSPHGPPVSFSALPLNKEVKDAYLNAWGAYGPDDELGFLNRQTDDTVAAAAASEIKTGIRVNLNADMNFLGSQPFFGRQAFQQDIYQKKPRIVHDDVWHFNTQSSTQWDGFRHFAYQKAQRFYNNTTLEDIWGPNNTIRDSRLSSQNSTKRDEKNEKQEQEEQSTQASTISSTRQGEIEHQSPTFKSGILGIQNFATRGIVGRAILVDVARWSSPGHPGHAVVKADLNSKSSANTTTNITPSLPSSSQHEKGQEKHPIQPFTRQPIPLSYILSTLEYQNNTTPKFSDILFIRTGFFSTIKSTPSSVISSIASAHPTPPTLTGVQPSLELLKWIWDHFSAVAGDQPGFEVIPMAHISTTPTTTTTTSEGKENGKQEESDIPASMHEILLGGWGCPIGELFDLEDLSSTCETLQRWSFFLTSQVGNVHGGVASPGNAIAIF